VSCRRRARTPARRSAHLQRRVVGVEAAALLGHEVDERRPVNARPLDLLLLVVAAVRVRVRRHRSNWCAWVNGVTGGTRSRSAAFDTLRHETVMLTLDVTGETSDVPRRTS